MIRVIVFLLALAAAAFGISWLLDRPGEVTILWLGDRIETSVFVALGVVVLACVAFTILWSLFAFVFRVPSLVSLARRARKHARGRDALSRGMIAVGAGDLRAARRAAQETARAIPHEPMGLLLRAQVAQMEGDRSAAESAFAEMASKDSTRLLGLRGLHVEAHRRGDAEAAHRYAQEAHRVAPLPWAGEAIVAHHAVQTQWRDALGVVESNAKAKIIDAATANRQRAVLETAIALENEFVDSDGALKNARAAAKRAPDLVPAVALAARLLSRRGDFRAASKLVERAWDDGPHPELAAAYLAIRPGDSNADRFARATALARRMPDHPESHMLVAEAALAARDFSRAREAMRTLVSEEARPTTRQCLMMADIEETENGETGLLREWLARASRAPRDPTWVADGVTSVRWAPASPVTGKLDAFRWQTPREELGAVAREPQTAPVSVELPKPPLALPVEPEPQEKGTATIDALDPEDRPDVPRPVVVADASTGGRSDVNPTPAGTGLLAAEPLPAPPEPARTQTLSAQAAQAPQPVVFPLAAPPDDPGPRPSGSPYSGGFRG